MEKIEFEKVFSRRVPPEFRDAFAKLLKEPEMRDPKERPYFIQMQPRLYRRDYYFLMKKAEERFDELFREKWGHARKDVLELIGLEFERRFNEALVTLGKIATEIAELKIKEEIVRVNAEIKRLNEIISSESSLEKERIDFNRAMNELKQDLLKSTLPNPRIFLKEVDSQKVIHVVIDDSDKYLDYLSEFSKIVIKLRMRYDVEMELLLFENREIKIPLEKRGFQKA